MRSITPEQLKRWIDDGKAPELIDVREPWEFEICHILGSINIPMSDIVSTVEKLDKQTEKVVICHHGLRSQQVANYLEFNGFGSIINLEGGLDQWAKTVDPDMPRY